VLGLEVLVAVDSVDHECRVGEDPDSIDPVTARQLKTGDESFVLRFMMVSSPSDPLRYLIYIRYLWSFSTTPIAAGPAA
jgi:hypothetical protein